MQLTKLFKSAKQVAPRSYLEACTQACATREGAAVLASRLTRDRDATPLSHPFRHMFQPQIEAAQHAGEHAQVMHDVEVRIALLERQDALERKRLGIDKEGFATDKTGQRLTMGGDLTTLTGVAAFLKSAGVEDDATARRIAMEFANEKGQIQYDGNVGQRKYGGSTISDALLKAAEAYTFAAKKSTPASTEATKAAAAATQANAAPSVAAPSSTSTSTRTVNINFNGEGLGGMSLDAVSDKVFDKLVSKLEAAKRAAGY